MNFDQLDWPILDRLRGHFLSGQFPPGGYWLGPRDLAQYDQTFAERIGWKWDAVLRELSSLGWMPPKRITRVIDWGCGSGVAGRRVLAAHRSLRTLALLDSSHLAVEYSRQRCANDFPDVTTESFDGMDASGSLLLLSHVWNELGPAQRDALLRLISSAAAVIWVEPGTHSVARELQMARDSLRQNFEIIAPCTHRAACGLLAADMDRHWCHHFADPSPEAFTSGDWARFAERAGIDLRALPYSYLVLQQTPPNPSSPVHPSDEGWERLIGRARVHKPLARVFSCGINGACEIEVTRRHLPDWYRALKRESAPTRVRWIREADRVIGAEPAIVPQ
jgi:hypothetical protein